MYLTSKRCTTNKIIQQNFHSWNNEFQVLKKLPSFIRKVFGRVFLSENTVLNDDGHNLRNGYC